MSTGKKSLLAILIPIILFGLVVDIWYIYLKAFAGERFTSTTQYVNQLTSSTGEKEDVVYVKYHSNKNQNGLESLDVKFSYFTDENRTNFYWQGIQYVANSKENKIDWYNFERVSKTNNYLLADQENAVTTYILHEKTVFLKNIKYNANYFSPFVNSQNTSKYNYQSLDNFATLNSTNPITEESYFTLQAGEDLFYMKFRGDDYASYNKLEKEFVSEYEPIGVRDVDYVLAEGVYNYYNNYTIDYFCYQIYEAIQTLPAGTNGSYTLEFGDIFRYYKADANKYVGDEINTEDTDLVINQIKTYFTMHVEVSADGAQSARDSIFGVLHGSPSYVVDGATGDSGNFYTGIQVLSIDYRYFDRVQISGIQYAFKLKEDFINAYKSFTKSISLRITIDQNILINKNIEFVGFTADSGLELFNVESINIISLTEVA